MTGYELDPQMKTSFYNSISESNIYQDYNSEQEQRYIKPLIQYGKRFVKESSKGSSIRNHFNFFQ